MEEIGFLSKVAAAGPSGCNTGARLTFKRRNFMARTVRVPVGWCLVLQFPAPVAAEHPPLALHPDNGQLFS
jgi:hypothetical protein